MTAITIYDNNVFESPIKHSEYSLEGLLQTQLAIVLPDNPVALAGGVFKFLAVDDLHCATRVLDESLLLQDASSAG